MLTTTLRSSTYLVLGVILITSVTGCSGCQQQTTIESTSTEDAAKDSSATSNSDTNSIEKNAVDAEQPNRTEETEPASNESGMNAKTASNSTQTVGQTQTARSDSARSPASASTMNAGQALTKAKELFTSARSGNQDPGEAFKNASEAWELLNQHPDNAECQVMAAEIFRSLDSMAAKANQKYSTKLSGNPVLIEK